MADLVLDEYLLHVSKVAFVKFTLLLYYVMYVSYFLEILTFFFYFLLLFTQRKVNGQKGKAKTYRNETNKEKSHVIIKQSNLFTDYCPNNFCY